MDITEYKVRYCDKLGLPALFVSSSFLYQQRLSECTERDWVRLVEIYDRPDGINSSKLILFCHSFSSSPRTCRPSANTKSHPLLSLDTLNHQTICINIFMILCEKTLFVVKHSLRTASSSAANYMIFIQHACSFVNLFPILA